MRTLASIRDAGRMLLGRLSGRPRLMAAFIYPTHRCNLRCLYCESPYLKTPELATGRWLSIIDELAGLGCRRVSVLGGEPLLRPDLPEMLGRVRERGMACVLVSNGVLVKRRIDELAGLSTLVLSLDGLEEVNDAVRGRGVFAAVSEAIDVARARGIPVKLNAVVTSVSEATLDELMAFVESEDLHLTINLVRPEGAGLCGDISHLLLGEASLRRAFERLADLARVNPRLLFSEATYRFASRWGDYSRSRLDAEELEAEGPWKLDAPPCQAGRYYMTIHPDGAAYPCVLTAGRIEGASVLEEGVEGAWRRLRGHGCKACYAPCLVELNHLYSLKPSVLLNFLKKHVRKYC